MTFTIRPVAESDINQVAGIYREAMTAAPYSREISPELAVQQMESDMLVANFLVVEEENKIIGMTTAFEFFDNELIIWVTGLFVAPGARGRGVGSALIEELKKNCPNAKRIELLTKHDSPAVDFYEGKGFEKSGYIHFVKEL